MFVEILLGTISCEVSIHYVYGPDSCASPVFQSRRLLHKQGRVLLEECKKTFQFNVE